jgi:hypothetical protein
MAYIQPITTWYQGAEHEANVFTLYSTGDNLIDAAIFKYQLIEEIIIDEEVSSKLLLNGELSINGQDYIDWDTSVSANEWIYNWAADKLGLTIINL